MKSIAGIHATDEGRFLFEGRPVKISTPSDAVELGIATVYQDLALCDNLDVVANLFLGQEVIGSGVGAVTHQLDETAMEHRSHELLEQFAVTIPSVRSEVGGLSGGQRQQVAVARSLLGEPKVVLLDEPTAALGVAQTATVLELIKRLRERGLGVVVISHNLADVFAVADRIFVLRLGRPAGIFDVREASREDVVAAITGATEAERKRQRRGAAGVSTTSPPAPTGLERPTRGEILRRFVQGDLASLRVILGVVVIWIIFQSQNDRFLTAVNLTNLMLQITAVGLISVGVVYVLLLGEIDLSVGAVSGLAAAVMAVLNVKHGWDPYLAIAAGVACGMAIGVAQGALFTSFGIPSFVVTLAGLLIWQGALLYVLGDTGTINITDSKITGLANTFYSDAVGWTMALVAIGVYAAATLWAWRQRVAAGLADRQLTGPVDPDRRGRGRRDRGGRDPELGPRRAAGGADPRRLRGRHGVRREAHALRPSRLCRGRQRRGGAAGGNQRAHRSA